MPAPIEYLIEVQGQAEAASELERFDDSLEKVDETAERTTTTTSQLYGSISQAALGFSVAASGAFALFNQYDQLEKIELRIATAEKAQDDAVRQVIDARRALEDLTAKGITSGAQFESATLRLSSALQQQQIAEERLNQAQGDLMEGQIAFALNVMPTVFGAISGVSSAMTALRAIQTASTAAQAASVPVTVADVGAKSALAVAAGSAATATGGLAVAVRGLMLSALPVAAPLIAITTLLGLYGTNAFGARDAMNAMGKAIGDALPFLRPLLEILRGIADAITGVQSTTEATNQYASTAQATGAVVEIAGDRVATYGQHLDTLATELERNMEQNLQYIASQDEVAASLVTTAEQADRVASFLRTQQDEASKTAQENFNLVSSIYGIQTALSLSTEDLADFADALRRQKEFQQEATEAAERERDAQEQATREIRDRIEANVELARSFGITIDLSNTTVSETDRIAEHLRDAQRDYEHSRKAVEDFAIAHGVNVVDAVKMSDEELKKSILTLGTMDEQTFKTSNRLIESFDKARERISEFQKSASSDSQIFADNFVGAADRAVDANLKLQKQLENTIRYYERLATAARLAPGGGGSRPATSHASSAAISGLTNFGRLSAIPNAEGGEYVVDRPTLFLAGEAGIEHAKFTPLGSGREIGESRRTTIIIQLDGREIARYMVDEHGDLMKFV